MNNKKQLDYELTTKEHGWNLYDARTNQKIDPINLATNEKVRMSKWEIINFAIQIVRDGIEKEGNKILSFCDLPEVNPQIWFRNKNGETRWVIVKYIKNENELDYKKWAGLEAKSPQLKPYDGYFAAVQLTPSIGWNDESTFPTDLFRGDGMYVNYKGLEKIYVSQ